MENTYIVLMDDEYIRDAQMFDTAGMSFDELDNLDMYAPENEDRWKDTSPTPYIGYVSAESEADAVQKIAKDSGYDPRMLYAIRINNKT